MHVRDAKGTVSREEGAGAVRLGEFGEFKNEFASSCRMTAVQEEVESSTPLTREDVTAMLGELDDVAIAKIIATGPRPAAASAVWST